MKPIILADVRHQQHKLIWVNQLLSVAILSCNTGDTNDTVS